MKTLKKLLTAALILSALALCLASCKETPASEDTPPEKNPVVTIEMENGALITLELYYEKAPNTVKNFVSLINKGFYDGLSFHRVKDGFMIQGGDPEGTGGGGPGYTIAGEMPNNGFAANDISHKEGIISMARKSGDYDSGGSQFFICSADSLFLDGEYAAFGAVLTGIEEVRRIATLNTSADGGQPSEPQIMKKVTADTFGAELGEPKTIK